MRNSLPRHATQPQGVKFVVILVRRSRMLRSRSLPPATYVRRVPCATTALRPIAAPLVGSGKIEFI